MKHFGGYFSSGTDDSVHTQYFNTLYVPSCCLCVCLCLGGSGGREQAEHENQTDAKADPTPGRGENHRETNTPMWCADTHWTSLIHHFTWTKPCTVQCFCCSPKFTWWYFMVDRRNIGDWIYLFVVSSTSCLVLMQTLSDADKKQLLNFDYVHISTMVNLNMSTSQEEIRSSNRTQLTSTCKKPRHRCACIFNAILLHERILPSRINLLMVSDWWPVSGAP